MSRRRSWLIWGAIIAILLFSGLLTALWPLITGSLAGTGAGGAEAEQFVFNLPIVIPVLGIDVIVLSSVQLFALVAALVIGLTLAFGIPLAIVSWFLSRQTTKVTEDEGYQEHVANLTQREKEKLAHKNEGREVSGPRADERRFGRWDAVATGIIVVFFVVCVGILVESALFPEAALAEASAAVSTTLLLIGVPALIAVLILAWRLRPARLDAFESAGETTKGIPWDFIAVLSTGLLIVGIGLGLMVFLNS